MLGIVLIAGVTLIVLLFARRGFVQADCDAALVTQGELMAVTNLEL